jgi:hypothetical protein
MDQCPLIAHLKIFDFQATLCYLNYLEYQMNVTLKTISYGKGHYNIHYLFLGESDSEE